MVKVFREKAVSRKIIFVIFPCIHKDFPHFSDVFSDHVVQARGGALFHRISTIFLHTFFMFVFCLPEPLQSGKQNQMNRINQIAETGAADPDPAGMLPNGNQRHRKGRDAVPSMI